MNKSSKKQKIRLRWLPPHLEHNICSDLSLSSFNLRKIIGVGAFGKVLKATLISSKKSYALKAISKEMTLNKKELSQLHQEIAISQQIDHPNCVRTLDAFEDNDNLYLVMGLVRGESLLQIMKVKARFTEEEARALIKQLFEAIAYLHSLDPIVIHRDIKLENIMYHEEQNKVVLIDFGSSCIKDCSRNTVVGTLDYFAPEIVSKSEYDEKIDLWCLGVVIYELLVGKSPFNSEGVYHYTDTNVDIIGNRIQEYDPPLPDFLSKHVRVLILDLLQKDPSKRLSAKEGLQSQYFNIVIAETHQNSDELTEVMLEHDSLHSLFLKDSKAAFSALYTKYQQKKTLVRDLNQVVHFKNCIIKELEEKVELLEDTVTEKNATIALLSHDQLDTDFLTNERSAAKCKFQAHPPSSHKSTRDDIFD